jgi:hypothetical protein
LFPTGADPCVYAYKRDTITILVSVHVDDQLIACNERPALDLFKKRLNAQFECTDNGAVNYFLGSNVIHDGKIGKQDDWTSHKNTIWNHC